MTVQLKKVEGGYQLFIPEELASAAGLAEGAPLEVLALGTEVVVRNPEHRQAVLDRMLESVTPENRHAEVDFGPPVGKERFWEDE